MTGAVIIVGVFAARRRPAHSTGASGEYRRELLVWSGLRSGVSRRSLDCAVDVLGEGEMDFSTRFEELEKRTSDALATVRSAATASRDQLRGQIDQAQVDLDLAGKDAKQEAGEAADRAQTKWAQMKADAKSRMDDVKAKIDKRNAQLDAKMADNDAEEAEAEAADAIDYAEWTVQNARLVALDALDARAYANELARAASD
jgi:hypothetical protein